MVLYTCDLLDILSNLTSQFPYWCNYVHSSFRAAYKGFADTIRLLLFLGAYRARQDKEGMHWIIFRTISVFIQKTTISPVKRAFVSNSLLFISIVNAFVRLYSFTLVCYSGEFGVMHCASSSWQNGGPYCAR